MHQKQEILTRHQEPYREYTIFDFKLFGSTRATFSQLKHDIRRLQTIPAIIGARI